jgi:hypothetical protein
VQLFRNGGNETLQNLDFFFNTMILSIPLAVRDQPLHGASGQVRDTPRTSLFAHAYELPEFVLRDTEVD